MTTAALKCRLPRSTIFSMIYVGMKTMINTINIRLMGTLEECQTAIDKLDALGLTILETSRFYPNRGETKQGRVYVTIRI